MQFSIIGALLLVIVACVQSQGVLVGGRGSRFARQQILQRQRLLEQQAVNNAIVNQQLGGGLVGNVGLVNNGLVGNGRGVVNADVGVVGSMGVPVVSTVVGGAGYGLAGARVGLTGLSGCCARTDQQACIAVRPLSSYGSGATCQRWYYDALTGTCQRATFDLVCATGRGFTNYFKSQALCLAKCGGAVVGGY